jgi:hypothetical protein
MADLKLTDLISATQLTSNTIFYAVQDGISKQFPANVILENIIDPIFRNSVAFQGVQLIRETDLDDTVSLGVVRTEYDIEFGNLYPTLPNGNKDGLFKIITLANTQGGKVYFTQANSNIIGNVSVEMYREGDTMMLLYSSNAYSNGWVIVGTTPGLRTNLELDEANVSDERIRQAISAKDQTINYDRANGTIQVGDISNLVVRLSLANVDTDDVAEGNTNLYFTPGRVEDALAPVLNAIRKPNANVIYVAANGNDSLDGRTPANAVANIHVAVSKLTQRFQTVQVFPGDYTLYGNPVTLPARTSLIGNDLRTTTIRPEFPTLDMFYMNNGCYVFGFTFRGHRAANPSSVKTGSAVFSYNPDGSAGNITTSPYIQNCSSITTSGTGVRVDGNYVGGLRSMVLDAFTQFNEGGIGVHMLNQGYMQLVSLFTICCEYSVLCENGGFGSITNSNTSFGTYGLFVDGVSPALYRGITTSATGQFGGTGQINQRTVQMNLTQRPNINDRVIIANYRQDKCSRDTGLIVDSIAMDLAYNSNTQSKFSGIQYWAQGLNIIDDQRIEVRTTFDYVKNLLTNVVVNSTSWDNSANVPYQIANVQVTIGGASGNANLIANTVQQFLDVYDTGVFAFTDRIVPNQYPASTDIERQRTANLLIANKSFIQSEANAYFAINHPTATYIPDRTVYDDAGKLVDSLVFDVLHAGNRQTLTLAALFFEYKQDSTVQNQVVQTSAAFSFIKTIIGDIVQNTAIANVYQTNFTQNTSVAGSVSGAEIQYLQARLDDIVTIIDNGAYVNNDPYRIRPIGRVANTSPNVVTAVNRVFANRDFIRGEVIGYVNRNWMDISNGTRNFYTVSESTLISGNTYNVVFDEKILAVDRPVANSAVSFHQGSYLSASSHTFEYVGSGTQLLAGVSVLGTVNSNPSCLPFNGGLPIQTNEVQEIRGGAVYYTSTDHKGDFRIGNELLISRAAGTINGRTFFKSLFAVMTPYILSLQ